MEELENILNDLFNGDYQTVVIEGDDNIFTIDLNKLDTDNLTVSITRDNYLDKLNTYIQSIDDDLWLDTMDSLEDIKDLNKEFEEGKYKELLELLQKQINKVASEKINSYKEKIYNLNKYVTGIC